MRKILFILATILIFRYIFKMIAYRQKAKANRKARKEGSVTFKNTNSPKSSVNKKHGEYVDFEEVE